MHGRGRLGRAWADTAAGGIAMTVVLDRGSPERLSIATAVAAARAAESLLHRSVGIKWPNDIVVNDRKLAGILIEQFKDCAYVGIGMNIAQRTWPDDLKDIAISMAECGVNVSRADAMAAILRALNVVLPWTNEEIVTAFTDRDALTGTTATLQTDGKTVTGIVKAIDPMRGLMVECGESGQQHYLPAATTTIIKT